MCRGGGKVQVGNDFRRARFHSHAARALRRDTQLEHLTVRAKRKRPQGKQLIVLSKAMDCALYCPCRTIERRLARRQQQPAVFWNALEELYLLLRDAFTIAERG